MLTDASRVSGGYAAPAATSPSFPVREAHFADPARRCCTSSKKFSVNITRFCVARSSESSAGISTMKRRPYVPFRIKLGKADLQCRRG
jgi:hypothetical protein